MFNDKMVKMIPPGMGLRHFYFIIRMLSEAKNYGGKFSLTNILNFTLGYMRRETILFIVSDFLGLEKGWQRQISMAAMKYDLTGKIKITNNVTNEFNPDYRW